MRTINASYERFGAFRLCLGREGENLVTEVRIKVSVPLSKYPEAWFGIEVQPPAGEAYPAVFETKSDELIWPITDSDLARSGNGRVQIVMYGDEGEIGRSPIAETVILPSVVATGDAPAPIENWLDEAQRVLEELKNNTGGGGSTGGGASTGLPSVSTEDNGKVLTVVGGKWEAKPLPLYDGTYSVTPSTTGAQTMRTAGKLMDADITVQKIPYFETSNTSDGVTVIIGSEV